MDHEPENSSGLELRKNPTSPIKNQECSAFNSVPVNANHVYTSVVDLI